MVRATLSAALLLSLAVAVAPAAAARPVVAADEQVVEAAPAYDPHDGKPLAAPTSRNTVAFISFSFYGGACGGAQPPKFRRIAIHRTPNAVTVYVITSRPTAGSPLPPGEACPAIAVGQSVGKRRISLGGRLGRRAIIDGSTSPGRVIFPRPTR